MDVKIIEGESCTLTCKFTPLVGTTLDLTIYSNIICVVSKGKNVAPIIRKELNNAVSITSNTVIFPIRTSDTKNKSGLYRWQIILVLNGEEFPTEMGSFIVESGLL